MGKRKLLSCDDELSYAEDIRKMIDDLYLVLYEIQTATNQSFDTNAQFDIYFLDINMPSISGFDLAEKIHNRYPEALIISLTTHKELSVEGYQYQAF